MSGSTKTKYLRKLIYWRPVREVLHTSRMLVIPGFQGVPLFDVTVFFIKGLMKGVLNQRAAAVSFHFVLAIFPLVLFFFTLLPYFDTAYYAEQLFSLLKETLPENVYPAIEKTLIDILHRKHNGLLSVGFISSVYVASSGINAMLVSFNQSHHSIEKRKWLKRRLLSILMVVIIAIVVLISFTLIGGFILKSLKWFLLISIVYLMFAALYYWTPANRKNYTFFSAGASLATLLFILTTQGFNFYILHFSRYNALYGSIGVLIIFLLWTYLNSFILLIGFELNASIAEARTEKFASDGDRMLQLNRTSRTASPLKRWQRWQRRRKLKKERRKQ